MPENPPLHEKTAHVSQTAGAMSVPVQAWRGAGGERRTRLTPEEVAVALVFNGATEAVMMASPLDLEDFGLGFSLTEGLIANLDEVRELEVLETELGWEVRLWIAPDRAAELSSRRRRQAGPTGCGMCGLESLEAARRPAKSVRHLTDVSVTAANLFDAFAALEAAQVLGSATRAVHAAGFWTPGEGLVCLREDVGRHNALDKVVGALARSRRAGADGIVLLTSRVSVEMVQKSCALGASVLAAVSAPTTLALEVAQAAGLSLIGVARTDGFEVFVDELHRVRIEPAFSPQSSGGLN